MSVVEIQGEGRVVTVTLNRPELKNAMNPEMVVRLARLWGELADDPQVWAVVLTGAAGSTFCAGADLRSLAPLQTGAREPVDEWDEAMVADPSLLGRSVLAGVRLGKPLVVAANGHAIGGGMGLVLAGDIRVMAAGARMAYNEVKLGLLTEGGGTALLGRALPPALATEVLVTGEPITAERAWEVGFVNHVVPAADVLAKAQAIARSIASNAPLAVQATMEVMAATAGMTESDALTYEAARAIEIRATADAREGPLAYMEKRVPVFQGH